MDTARPISNGRLSLSRWGEGFRRPPVASQNGAGMFFAAPVATAGIRAGSHARTSGGGMPGIHHVSVGVNDVEREHRRCVLSRGHSARRARRRAARTSSQLQRGLLRRIRLRPRRQQNRGRGRALNHEPGRIAPYELKVSRFALLSNGAAAAATAGGTAPPPPHCYSTSLELIPLARLMH